MTSFNSFMTEAVSYRNQSIDNQWTGFYMITAPVMKELSELIRGKYLTCVCFFNGEDF